MKGLNCCELKRLSLWLLLAMSLVFLCSVAGEAFANDPWQELQQRVEKQQKTLNGSIPKKHSSQQDPWRQLQAIYLTFTQQQESDALVDNVARRKVAGELHKALKPYEHLIDQASRQFNIPREIIAAVIMVESGGDSQASATTSSAKGLMQTIDGTFSVARNGLRKQNFYIKDNPFDPRSSIMAGSWYLSRMFDLAFQDGKFTGTRSDVRSWKCAAEYYFAGPGNGRNKKDVVIVYSGGDKVVIDKPAYSQKVLRWAQIMRS